MFLPPIQRYENLVRHFFAKGFYSTAFFVFRETFFTTENIIFAVGSFDKFMRRALSQVCRVFRNV